MSQYTEKTVQETFPVVVLEDQVPFPSIPLSKFFYGNTDVNTIKNVQMLGGYFLAVNRADLSDRQPKITSAEQLQRVGCVCKITSANNADNGISVEADCYCRAEIIEIEIKRGRLFATVICRALKLSGDTDLTRTLRLEINRVLSQTLEKLPSFPEEVKKAIRKTEDPGQFADVVASTVLIRPEHKIAVLSEFDPEERLAVLLSALVEEQKIIDTELEMQKKTKAKIEENQRDYYLREQLRVIKRELGEDEDEDEEIAEYFSKILSADFDEKLTEKLIKEVHKLSKLPISSPESNVIRNYLDTVLELPWNKRTEDAEIELSKARRILDKDHDGMNEVKDRIIEYLAVRKLTPEMKNQIICLVGAPGVGKTSVASSIAKALGRKFVRVSLGGVRDEADIRGHRKTYVAAMPGRIINAINEAEVCNPLILLDEIDKLTRDSHGDPSSALLEVLDPDQNKNFRDHFLEIPFDLSDCIFIATANTLETIPRPLIDRMEIISMKSYSRLEKLSIAKHHLIPKQLAKHGLRKKNMRITDKVILDIIDHYTCEAGVRTLEKKIAAICRKIAMQVVENNDADTVCKITSDQLNTYLGMTRVIDEKLSEQDEIGVVNGLAYTDAGGDLLKVEALSVKGSGKLELTGSLGEVMKESAKIAITLIRKNAEQLGIDPDFYKTKDIHIHFPEGAVPKDGPSAGVTLVTALASELGGYPVYRDVAMTGEVTLRGKVVAIGGLREKTMAAYKTGIKTVIVPADNKQDVARLDDYIKEEMKFIYCERVDEVLMNALAVKPSSFGAK